MNPGTMTTEQQRQAVQLYGNRAERRRWAKIEKRRETGRRIKAERKHHH